MEKHELIDIVSRGSKVRKSINSHLIIGENTPEYDRGDILDANATIERITSKVEEVKAYLKQYIDDSLKQVSDEFFYETVDGQNVLVYVDPTTGDKSYVSDENGNPIIIIDPSIPTFGIGNADMGNMSSKFVNTGISVYDFDEVIDDAEISGEMPFGYATQMTYTPTVDGNDEVTYRFDYHSFTNDAPLVKYYTSQPVVTRIFDQDTGEFYIKVSATDVNDYYSDYTDSAYKANTESVFENAYRDSNGDFYKILEDYKMQKYTPVINNLTIVIDGQNISLSDIIINNIEG